MINYVDLLYNWCYDFARLQSLIQNAFYYAARMSNTCNILTFCT